MCGFGRYGAPVTADRTCVLGVDGCRSGWVGVVLDAEGRFAATVTGADIASAVAEAERCGELSVVAIDIPIGLPMTGTRNAEAAARPMVGRLSSSVFTTPTRAVLATADTYVAAAAVQRAAGGPGLSRQTYALVPKIREVDEWLTHRPTGVRVVEVHPEVAFAALHGMPLTAPKRSWTGHHHRRQLLRDVGVQVPPDPGSAGLAGVDDVVDAAVVAWTAHCVRTGAAGRVPREAEELGSIDAAIWFPDTSSRRTPLTFDIAKEPGT